MTAALDCFGALRLAMTKPKTFVLATLSAPELCQEVALKMEGAGKAGC
ncbi:MAG: hypothetical protein WA702_13755 [Bradyrhizobium sp.]